MYELVARVGGGPLANGHQPGLADYSRGSSRRRRAGRESPPAGADLFVPLSPPCPQDFGEKRARAFGWGRGGAEDTATLVGSSARSLELRHPDCRGAFVTDCLPAACPRPRKDSADLGALCHPPPADVKKPTLCAKGTLRGTDNGRVSRRKLARVGGPEVGLRFENSGKPMASGAGREARTWFLVTGSRV
jgi:hypothetical protein